MSSPLPGSATLTIGDTHTVVRIHGAPGDGLDTFEIPVGVRSLGTRHIVHDPPHPEELTNAIGEVLDHVDDVVRELPAVVDATHVYLSGEIARTMAAVEVGGAVDGAEFVLGRDAAEDVFRTLATEAAADRRHNPGLPADWVDTVVGGCCVVIGLLRGLQLTDVTVMMKPADASGQATAS